MTGVRPSGRLICGGKELLEEVVSATQLPQEPLAREMAHLLDRAKCSLDNMSLDDLRQILADYAQEVLLEAQATYSDKD